MIDWREHQGRECLVTPPWSDRLCCGVLWGQGIEHLAILPQSNRWERTSGKRTFRDTRHYLRMIGCVFWEQERERFATVPHRDRLCYCVFWMQGRECLTKLPPSDQLCYSMLRRQGRQQLATLPQRDRVFYSMLWKQWKEQLATYLRVIGCEA